MIYINIYNYTKSNYLPSIFYINFFILAYLIKLKRKYILLNNNKYTTFSININ